MDWNFESHLPPGVAEALGHYVYLYVDPRTDEPFYVGKGVGERLLAHFGDVKESAKTRLIAELKSGGIPPRLEILAHGLKDEETAFRVEAAVIDVLGLGSLTNAVRGWRSLQVGRMNLDDLAELYAAQPVNIDAPVLLVRVNKLYRKNMSALELYEATRGIWRLGKRRTNVRYAFSVFHGLVREVYGVHQWYPARTLHYETRDLSARDTAGRFEFEGDIAPASIRDKYRGKAVHQYLKRGNQSPTVYVGA
ncbi:LEM-3-like GIY-YIG domain-containing protein [Candidatus Thiodictyon syntrophicum]|jgi:hypothetical protein|uniref:GIY-YIG domain-containing protein n=1 Tax=Candidatus Thiodictyon syntrophicum TaxID=1166950 RepID=A0A2K8UFS5_9GAMM|nr:hypothetical protein [Candidatus Thiodictyon syntrophicum]AUB84433.1 hypothetical protein THSYN_28170 [Candidatus Thiodictyon syntrophicum]